MSALDKNKIFFGLIHYILSEQSNVDWILKTSLVNFTGINSTVDNKKYQQTSLTDDIIDYIYQIKPYHVTFEQFIEKYSSEQDDVNISTQDQNNIEMNIRFDAITSEVDEQGDMPAHEYMDTHMANRLWYFKNADLRNIYGNDEAVLNYIKDVMNCHFKGLEVDGSGFDIDKSGYDAFLYDSTLYDAPTLTADYCLFDYKEKINYPYDKKIIKVGLKSIKLDTDVEIEPTNLTIYSDYNGVRTEVKDYTFSDNIITFFYSIRQLEKITVINTVNKIRNAFVFVAHPFVESNEESNIRQFMDVETNMFPIPEGQLGSRKLTVHVQYPNGTRVPLTNFEKNGSYVIVYDKLEENYHVIITVIDYKQIYDKIYTYEDRFGQSNNVISLDGDEFLRPYYEKGRPSELCVSYPMNNLMIYTQNSKGDVQSMYNVDFKDEQYRLPIVKTMTTKLSQDLNIGDRFIEVDNLSKLILPYVGSNSQVVPGRVIVNSEIIEFYEYEKGDGQKGILKSLRRGAKGSFLGEKHPKGSLVYTYNNQSIVDCTSTSVNYSTMVTDKTNNRFLIPGEHRNDESIAVFKKSYIDLLSDITFIGKYFDISTNEVTLPGNVIMVSELEYSTVYGSQTLGMDIGGSSYQIKIDVDYETLDEFIKFISLKVPVSLGVQFINNDNKIKIVSSEGKAIKLFNIKGEPLQQLFGNNTIGKENISINMDGKNGLNINGYDILWGNDKRSVQWMLENPEKGTVDDVVDTINNLLTVNKMVKAYNRNGKLEIVSLTNNPVVFENTTDLNKPFDNIGALGINNIKTQDIFLNTDGEYNYYYSNPERLGYIFIDNEKLYFKNIETVVAGKSLKYRISNYYTSKEYKAGEAEILSMKFRQLEPSEYTINSEEDYVSLKKEPMVGEIIIVSNEK